MAKRVMRFSPEFIEDILEYSKDHEWTSKVMAGIYKITVEVDHEDGYALRVPIKVQRNPEDMCLRVEWEVTDEEEAFERLVFRQLRTE